MTVRLLVRAAGRHVRIGLSQFKMSEISSVVVSRPKRKAAVDANNKIVVNNKNARTDEDLELSQGVVGGRDALITDVNDTTGQVPHQSSIEDSSDGVEPFISVNVIQNASQNVDNLDLEDHQREADHIRVDPGKIYFKKT